MKLAVSIAAAVLVPGGFVLLAALWLRRLWVEKEQRAIALRIVPPRQVFGKTAVHEAENLRASAQRRRDHADDKRREAQRIDSGQPVEERLRLIGGYRQ